MEDDSKWATTSTTVGKRVYENFRLSESVREMFGRAWGMVEIELEDSDNIVFIRPDTSRQEQEGVEDYNYSIVIEPEGGVILTYGEANAEPSNSIRLIRESLGVYSGMVKYMVGDKDCDYRES